MTQESRKRRRPYDASGRKRQAEQRRLAVLRTAADVFAARGLEATTMPEIAEAADVSLPYLERLGSKADIFAMAIEVATLGPVHTMAAAQAEFEKTADTITRDQFISAVAEGSAEWNARAYKLWQAWAVTPDPALHERWERDMAAIRRGWAVFLARFDDRGWWRTDIPRAEQVATIWILTMAETYGRLTEQAGFTHDEYIAWLYRGLQSILLPPER
ncbi:TetR/AcrR family transcriptional regulator [Microbacterium sp.]|uniref:TetR/AcrR family transcriptional regulator n=1 Tax=Microbacterium sp. TaxID=51671 RepID=UPI003C74B5EE